MRSQVLCIIVLLFAVNLNAQTQKTTKKFPCSTIIVQVPDSDDSTFIAAAVRQELIHAGKITANNKGNVLTVRLTTKNTGGTPGFLSGGTQILFSIVSKDGSAVGTATNHILFSFDGPLHYKIIQILVKEAVENFEYIE